MSARSRGGAGTSYVRRVGTAMPLLGLVLAVALSVAFQPAAVAVGRYDLQVRGYDGLSINITGAAVSSGDLVHQAVSTPAGGVGFIYDSSANRYATNAIDDILPRPIVSDPKLQSIVDDLYRGTTNPNRVGPGTTADAVRNEILTGQPTGGLFHAQKAEQYSNALRSVLKADLSGADRLVAQSLLVDLQSALRMRP